MMSKDSLNLTPTPIPLPNELVNSTVGDLIRSGDIEIKKKGNKVTVRRMTDDSTLFLEYTGYPDGAGLSGTQISTTRKKKDLIRTVRQMRSEDMTYEEISQRTGMSAAYAHKLCKDAKKGDER